MIKELPVFYPGFLARPDKARPGQPEIVRAARFDSSSSNANPCRSASWELNLEDGMVGCGFGSFSGGGAFLFANRIFLILFLFCWSQLVFPCLWIMVLEVRVILIDGIPSHHNLLRRRVLPDPSSSICALCGWEFVSQRDLLGHFEASVGLGVNRRARSISSLVWHVVVWSIWKSRNDVTFSGRPFAVEELVDRAQHSSWIWFYGKTPDHPCFLYEWGVEPSLCWIR
ncbi:hypothetical protein L195_g018063 [Trifolium pratense]|uniref:Uncharacterized protein n=1 Tax=Trifolium pratense TaxID=57577 RepID=A0A2K3MVM2_TRIPR|nr:hypothetical protein L195_g018027 [Trifolium pratense]PNX94881.1 hypothetical protein L195_g018063 [Trifolium pratense]